MDVGAGGAGESLELVRSRVAECQRRGGALLGWGAAGARDCVGYSTEPLAAIRWADIVRIAAWLQGEGRGTWICEAGQQAVHRARAAAVAADPGPDLAWCVRARRLTLHPRALCCHWLPWQRRERKLTRNPGRALGSPSTGAIRAAWPCEARSAPLGAILQRSRHCQVHEHPCKPPAGRGSLVHSGICDDDLSICRSSRPPAATMTLGEWIAC